jgi:hypothetical protein
MTAATDQLRAALARLDAARAADVDHAIAGLLRAVVRLLRVRVVDNWTWNDPRWQDRIGADAEATVIEALRRAVDLRETLAEAQSTGSITARALYLVDVLNYLAALEGIDTSALWEHP